MNRKIIYFVWLCTLVCMLVGSKIGVEASNRVSDRWPATMLVQAGSSASIISSGMPQSLEEGLRQIGIDTSESYMLMDKQNNNYYYARYGEGTLLYGFGSKQGGWNSTSAPVGFKYTVAMIQDYDSYVKEHPESFQVIVPFREVRKHVYAGEIIVNTWFKQVEYPMYLQITFLSDSTGAPRVKYVMTNVQDTALRKQLQYLL